MKKSGILTVAVLILALLTACAAPTASPTAGQEASTDNSIVGKWIGTQSLFSEFYEFNSDGTGHNDNPLLAYDFEYEIENGVLNIYSIMFGLASDEPTKHEYSIDGDTLTMKDMSTGTEYTYVNEQAQPQESEQTTPQPGTGGDFTVAELQELYDSFDHSYKSFEDLVAHYGGVEPVLDFKGESIDYYRYNASDNDYAHVQYMLEERDGEVVIVGKTAEL